MDEFDRIANFFRPLSEGEDASLSLKDDVAVLSSLDHRLASDQLISADMLVEGVHFLPKSDPYRLAQKSLSVNLSDLAAKGAKPFCYFLSLALPPQCDEAWLKRFSDGLAHCQREAGLFLAGGDSVGLNETGNITIAITIIGYANNQAWMRRKGAKPSDQLWVSGPIGDGFLGLACACNQELVWELAGDDRQALLDHYETPQARLKLGLALAEVNRKFHNQHQRHGLVAMDISDGLIADCEHICRLSGVRAVIEAWQIPLSQAATKLVSTHPNILPALWSGGDDYQLLIAADASLGPELQELGCKAIGHCLPQGESKGNIVTICDRDGNNIPIEHKGYRHS